MQDYVSITTTKGHVLIAKLLAGDTIHYTRMALGDGEIVTQDPLELESLINQIMDVPITDVKSNGNNTATVEGSYDNAEIEAVFCAREIAIFATDPDEGEILFSYTNKGKLGEWIDPHDTPFVLERVVRVITLIGNATEVTADIASGLSVSKEELKRLLPETLLFTLDLKEEKYSDIKAYEIKNAIKNNLDEWKFTESRLTSIPLKTTINEGGAVEIYSQERFKASDWAVEPYTKRDTYIAYSKTKDISIFIKTRS